MNLLTKKCLATFASLVWIAPMVRAQGSAADPLEDLNLQIVEIRRGNDVVIMGKLKNLSEATVTLNCELENMTPSKPLPITVDSAGKKQFEIVTLRPTNSRLSTRYSYHFDWQVGSMSQAGVGSSPFSLPYKSGPYRINQGALGKFSHQTGSGNEYSIDFGMPVGTEICAARAGTVAGFRQDSDVGGTKPAYLKAHNYVIIRHEDGTCMEYCHLQKDGVKVTIGQSVEKGQVIALSGNTGYSSSPHLHISHFANIDGKRRKTFVMTFRMKNGDAVQVVEGRTY